jgi:pimeloyl-ACP methyl ester carboxylesterase
MTDNPETHFDAHKKADVALAVKFVREKWPDSHIVLLGLCAGSRVGFKAAVADPEIDGLIALSTTIITAGQNSPQSPYEPEDRMSEFTVAEHGRGIARFIATLRFLNPFWWRRRFPNFQGIGNEIKLRAKVLKYLILGIDTSSTRNEFLDAAAKYLSNDRKVLFVYGDRDIRPLQEFKHRFSQVPESDAGPQRLYIVKGGTHTFSSFDSQSDAIEKCYAWLDEIFEIADEEPDRIAVRS